MDRGMAAAGSWQSWARTLWNLPCHTCSACLKGIDAGKRAVALAGKGIRWTKAARCDYQPIVWLHPHGR